MTGRAMFQAIQAKQAIHWYLVLGGALASALPQAAVAQAMEQDAALEEITVYAQHRPQRLQDTPLGVTPFNGDTLARLGVDSLAALGGLAPGFLVKETSPNDPVFLIRGIRSETGQPKLAPRLSLFYNGVDVSRGRGAHFELYDIDRVEIVRGPQATLFGTAAAAGAVSVTTRGPQAETALGLTLETGNHDARSTTGFVTGGSERWQGRLAFMHRSRDGYVRNIAGSAHSQSPQGVRQADLQGFEHRGLRPSLRFTPDDSLTIDLVYSFEENNNPGTAFKSGVIAPTGGDTEPGSFAELSGSPRSHTALGRHRPGLTRRTDDLNLQAAWQPSPTLTVTAVLGARQFDSLELSDADGSQAWLLELGDDSEGEQFSQELRVVHRGARLTTLAGASHFREQSSQVVRFSTEESIYLNCLGVLPGGLPCVNPDGSVNRLTPLLTGGALDSLPYNAQFRGDGVHSNRSLFADFSLQTTDRLMLGAGLRHIREEHRGGYSSRMPNAFLFPVPLLPLVNTDGERFSAGTRGDDILPRLSALYAATDTVNLYASIGKGRRAAVVDITAARDAQGNAAARVTNLPAEIIWSYEAGIKGSALNKRLLYSAAAFYYDYSDFQVALQEESGNFVSRNAGAASNTGAEVELSASLGAGAELFANAAWIDARIDRGSTQGALAGNRFPFQPEWTASAGLLFATALGYALELSGSVAYSYRSGVYFTPENTPVAGIDLRDDGHGLLNLRLGIGSRNGRWSASLFADNLLDQDYLLAAGNNGAAFGFPTFVAGAPLMYGLQLTLRR